MNPDSVAPSKIQVFCATAPPANATAPAPDSKLMAQAPIGGHPRIPSFGSTRPNPMIFG